MEVTTSIVISPKRDEWFVEITDTLPGNRHTTNGPFTGAEEARSWASELLDCDLPHPVHWTRMGGDGWMPGESGVSYACEVDTEIDEEA